MALGGALQNIRSSFLGRLRIPINRVHAAGAATTLSLVRAFSESTYLDKNVVTERILNVVKNFDKVDPAKVRRASNKSRSCRVGTLSWNAP
jgi:NADH dehydrogenase (ubiquinone) 1 alpha/beta subcomplex 1